MKFQAVILAAILATASADNEPVASPTFFKQELADMNARNRNLQGSLSFSTPGGAKSEKTPAPTLTPTLTPTVSSPSCSISFATLLLLLLLLLLLQPHHSPTPTGRSSLPSVWSRCQLFDRYTHHLSPLFLSPISLISPIS